MSLRWLAAVCSILLGAAVLDAAPPSIPPAPTRWVTDNVGFMSPAAADRLNSRLQAYEQQTGHHLLVWIGDTTGDEPIADFGDRAFNAWKVGRTKSDDGLVLFVMAKDRRLHIQVGYGLEGDVPDATAFRIINETMAPRIRAGDNDGAVESAMEQVAQAIGVPLPGGTAPAGRRNEPRPLTLAQLIFYGIIGLIILIVLVTHPSLAMYLLANILIGGGRDRDGWGGGGGGGGWSGGGGRSGGGGASGSW